MLLSPWSLSRLVQIPRAVSVPLQREFATTLKSEKGFPIQDAAVDAVFATNRNAQVQPWSGLPLVYKIVPLAIDRDVLDSLIDISLIDPTSQKLCDIYELSRLRRIECVYPSSRR